MRLGSLCTGIGGLDLAVEAHFGTDLVWCAEWEDAPASVIERHWPGVPNLRDLTAIDWPEVEPVDVLTAGYPCQPFSHAGKRKGSKDERHLWPYIAEAVRVLRPRWVVLENVAGHLTLGFGDVLRDLAEAGFDAEWCVLRASDVGAPHQRARIFIVTTDTAGNAGRVGHRDGSAPADARGQRHGGGQDGGAVGRVDGRDEGQAPERQRPWEIAGDRSGSAAADATDLGHERAGRPRGRGAGPADGRLAPADANGGGLGFGVQRDGEASEPRVESPLGRDADGLGPAAWGQYAPAIARWERILGRCAPSPVDAAGRLSPPFVEWMMGYPEGWVDGLTRTQALKALGNAVVPQQGLAALRELVPLEQERVA